MLTERQLLILHAIVDDYVRSAEPVGSRSISKRADVQFSSATIRNEMADLEELGFLDKPHSSAGRVPSQKGYRYYVDHLLSPHRLTVAERSRLSTLASAKLQAIEEVFQESARILSEMTSYVSIVLGPELLNERLQKIQIVPLEGMKAIVILISETGHIENHIVQLDEHVTAEDLERTVNLLNERLRGVPFSQLQQKIQFELNHLFKAHIKNYKHVLAMLQPTLSPDIAEKLFFSGRSNLMEQPEFQDMEKMRMVYRTLEEESVLYDWLKTQHFNGLNVSIGNENQLAAFDECSIVTASFAINGQHVGTLGVIGPTRMEYRRMIKVVDSLSKNMSKLLTDH
ncbi:heat-inducible transcriptional repressor HrcA [Shouchella sp. 1P09AA]|uniref:heat-inducible transcriptional repressor HrcA n=1 Tax=Bacillaceae TaxID=186817 RepID=UPI000C06D376|nr:MULTISPECIES: heat-inducible transcriptional repressor HrcA [Bacillaceae]UTR07922.1 heat-inducible transcriptional repressor HrcA [Alkalihalobacillus sp. LMS6]